MADFDPNQVTGRAFGSVFSAPPEPTKNWLQGALPSKGRCCLVADGLGTRSSPSNTFIPLLDNLTPSIQRANPTLDPRGFSYNFPWHYSPSHTNVSLLYSAETLVSAYKPSEELSITYLTFSLAGPLFSLGLSSCLQTEQPNSASLPTSLILLQPAFHIGENGIAAYKAAGLEITPIEELLDPKLRLLDRVIGSLITIIAHGTPVRMLYWPGDTFVDYPQWLLDRLGRAGVVLTCLQLSFPPRRTRPFQRHSDVARHGQVHRLLEHIL